MLRGVQVDGELIRYLRGKKGFSQKELAGQAGISERTVRNAEKGMVLEVHIASYLAVSLGVALDDLVLQRLEEPRSQALRKWARKFCRSYLDAVSGNQIDRFLELFFPDAEWNCRTSPKLPFGNRYSGRSEIRSLLEIKRKWFRAQQIDFLRFDVERMDSEGDLLFFACSAECCDPVQKSPFSWNIFVCRLDEDLIHSVDQCIGFSESLENTPQPASKRQAEAVQ